MHPSKTQQWFDKYEPRMSQDTIYLWIYKTHIYIYISNKCAEQQWRGAPKPRSHPPTFLLGAGVSIRRGNRKPPSWPFMTNLSPDSKHLMLHPALWLKDFDSMQSLASCQTQLIIFRYALFRFHWFTFDPLIHYVWPLLLWHILSTLLCWIHRSSCCKVQPQVPHSMAEWQVACCAYSTPKVPQFHASWFES